MKKRNRLLTVLIALLWAAAMSAPSAATTPSGASGLTATLDSAATPAIAINPPSLTFAGLAVGSTSTAQSITVSNGGTAQLTMSMAITGDFAKTTTCGAKLAAGSTCTVSVTFTPTASGTRSGSLTITNNSVSTPYVVGLTGVGTAAAVNGACGSSNGTTVSTAPSANLCTTGTASSVAGSGPWTWSCTGSNGGTNASCSASITTSTAVNGACGSANGTTVSTAPSSNLCTTGTASSVAGSGPWTWSCTGSSGGTNASCSASLVTSGDPTAGVLPSYNDAYPNWAKAGLVAIGGIPARSDCTSAQAGVTLPLAPSGGDDLSNIQTALDNCPTNTVIELGPGNFKISSATANHDIWIHRSVTLRGSGTCNNSAPPYCQTVILASPGGATQGYVSGGSNCNGCAAFAAPPIYISPANFLNGPGYSWTGCNWGSNCDNNAAAYQLTSDGIQGSNTIQLNRVNGLTVGGWVRIDENDEVTSTLGPLGNMITAAVDLLLNSGSPATFRTVQADIVNGQEYGALLHRATSEIHLITAIGGACGTNCVTFDSPLTLNYRVSHVAQIYTPNNAFITQVGVENLTIEGGVGGQTGGPLHMDFCAYCWLKNVETYYWIGGVGISNSARVQVDESYFHDCSDCENNGNEYPFAIDGATSESLIQNSIFRLAGKGMVGRACGGGNVVAYNYVDDTFYQASSIGNYWLDLALNGSHYVGCHDTLFEGNWADNCDNDSTHGNDEFHVYFRNWCTGLRSNFTDPSLANPSSSTYNSADSAVSDLSGISYANGNAYPYTPGDRHAAGTMMTDYWMAFVGNVLGEPGVTCASGCTMSGWVYSSTGAGESQKDKSIWMTGWVGGGSPDPYLTSTSGTGTCNGSSPPGCTYFFRHGNYDTVTASVADYQTGYSTTLPNSFYASSTPAVFTAGASCTYPWPWVTPAGSTQIQKNSCGGSGLPAKARFDAGTPFKQP